MANEFASPESALAFLDNAATTESRLLEDRSQHLGLYALNILQEHGGVIAYRHAIALDSDLNRFRGLHIFQGTAPVEIAPGEHIALRATDDLRLKSDGALQHAETMLVKTGSDNSYVLADEYDVIASFNIAWGDIRSPRMAKFNAHAMDALDTLLYAIKSGAPSIATSNTYAFAKTLPRFVTGAFVENFGQTYVNIHAVESLPLMNELQHLSIVK